MHRVWIACTALAWLTPLDAVGQSFQFMSVVPQWRPSLLTALPSPRGVATGGDIDGDGFADLVVRDTTFEMHVSLRSGIGWVNQRFSAWSTSQPVLLDLEGDGDLDLFGVPERLPTMSPVSVFRYAAGVMTPVALPWGADPAQGVAIGDVDADGLADMVIATTPGSVIPSLVVARGAPGPQFTLDTASMPTTGLPYGLWPVLLDLDGDGDLDVLASNATSGLRLLRNASGVFTDATASLPPARTGHDFLVAGDFDADGYGDCAATTTNGDIDLLWGGSTGFTFATAVVNAPGFRRLWPADFDDDGDLDLLAHRPDGLDVLWNLGQRQFARSELQAGATTLQGVTDLDGDGAADVLFSRHYDAVVRCKYRARFEDAAWAHGPAAFVGFAIPRSGPTPGDVDGDGRTDLVYANVNEITVDHALGGGVYLRSTSTTSLPGSGYPWFTQLGDLDGDGDLDLVVRRASDLILVANGGAGAFAAAQQLPSISPATDAMRLGDVDSDGDLDIVVAESSGVVLFRNLGSMTFAPAAVVVPTSAWPTSPAPQCVELVDVDGDGDLDLVTNIVGAMGVGHVMLANDGSGNFAPRGGFRLQLGVSPTSVRAADVDGDRDFDLVVVDSIVRLHRNDGRGYFTETAATDIPPQPSFVNSNVIVGDLDEDGDADVCALTAASAFRWLLLTNDGTGRFTDRSIPRCLNVGSGTSIQSGDCDDDGDIDIMGNLGGWPVVITNHVRQCRTTSSPRLGGVADCHLISGPGFGQPGVGLLGLAFATAATPIALPGLAGRLDLDPATLQVVAAVTTSTVGVSSAFVAVPQLPALFGLEFWFQGALVPTVGRPGFTNAVYERVLW